MVVDLRFQCLFAAVVMVGWQCLLLVVWVGICSVVFDILPGRRIRRVLVAFKDYFRLL